MIMRRASTSIALYSLNCIHESNGRSTPKGENPINYERDTFKPKPGTGSPPVNDLFLLQEAGTTVGVAAKMFGITDIDLCR